MEFRQLQYFVAVAEEASFTRAAARVHVAQPAISQQVAQLERELGEKLFDRSERQVRLTPAGEAFLPHAQAALDATTGGRDAVLSLRGELAGMLTIGTIPSPPPWLIGQLAHFQRRHPKVRLILRSGSPDNLAADVTAGALDAAVIGVSAGRLPAGPAGQRLPAALASAMVATERLVIAVAQHHPLADTTAVTLSQLRNEHIATLTPGTGLRAVLENACAEAGFTPQIHVETDDLSVLADLAAHGLGVALIPRSAAERTQLDLVILALRRPALHRRMALVWHRHRLSTPGRAFLEQIQMHDKSTQPPTRGVPTASLRLAVGRSRR
jgi:DNA-binding transcriptional LysR family regulator